jgi:hypothetical protein
VKEVSDKDWVILSMRLFASLAFLDSSKGWGKKRKIESETDTDTDRERWSPTVNQSQAERYT